MISKQKKIKSPILFILVGTILLINTQIVNATKSGEMKNKPAMDQTYGSTTVCELKDDKKAAYTFTTDDGIYSAVYYFNEDFKRLDLRGSMALITGKLQGQEDKFRALIAEGHFDVTNHSMTHVNFSTVSDSATLDYEINGAQSLLKSTFAGQDVITMANPYVSNTDLSDKLIKQHHYAGRNGGDGFNSLNPTETEWYRLKYITAYNYSLSQSTSPDVLNSSVDIALANRNWLIILTHGAGVCNGCIPKPDITAHFEYVASKLDSIWCGTFNEVTKYIREKQHAVINTKQSKPSRIVLNLTHDLDSTLFRFPLTLKTKVPEAWNKIAVLQNGISKTVTVKSENGINYAYYDAVPNLGDITLTTY